MAGGRFAKQGNFKGYALWNSNNANDSVVGGALTVSPAGSGIGTQAWQNFPGDRVILSPTDAVAFQNNNTGNLYTGTFRYVGVANSVGAPALGLAAFFVPKIFDANNFNQATNDANYQVTVDELTSYGVSLFAGVFINNVPKGSANNNSFWWIQESGKVRAQFDAMAGSGVTPAIGAGVYLNAAGNNNANAAKFTQINGLNSSTDFAANTAGANSAYSKIDALNIRFVGVAEQLPSNNNISVVDIYFRNGGFRW